MATLPTLVRECQHCQEGNGICNAEVIGVRTSSAHEVFVRCAPASPSGSAEEQARKFYDCLPRVLDAQGVTMHDVVLERVFFRDLRADAEMFRQTRDEAYRLAGIARDRMPAASCIEQPPCRPIQAFEMQLYAITSGDNSPVRVHSFAPTPQGTTAKLVEAGGYEHLYIANINGCDDDGHPRGTFRQQSDRMFERSANLLQKQGIDFRKVLRTWCYLDNIDQDYDEFNWSRNEFFQQHEVQRLPASTGIRGGLYPHGTPCGMDLYALLNPQGAQIEIMHTPTLNEAAEYGSSFSRGLQLSLPDKHVLFISGTASVDERGETIHVNDTRQQVERMLLNVRELLKPYGATFANVVQVITYLKSRQSLNVFLEIWERWGLGGLPNSFVEAGVCRPELLCELEAIAILPRDVDE